MRYKSQLLLVSLLLLAFGLRMYRLSAQSLWFDEGMSLHLARLALPSILINRLRSNPPFYFVLLHFWVALAGASEFGGRFFSVVPGVLTVALIGVLGRRLFDRTTSVAAAALTALSPLYVWYSQEARSYAWLTCLGLLSSVLFWQILSENQSRSRRLLWISYVLTGISATYMHTSACFVLMAQGLFFLYYWVFRRRSLLHLFEAGISYLLVALAILLWVFLSDGPTSSASLGAWGGSLSPSYVLWRGLVSFSSGGLFTNSMARGVAMAWGLLLVLALLSLLSRLSGYLPALIFLLLYLVVPLVLWCAILIYTPKFQARYLMAASPPFFLLLAAGLSHLTRVDIRMRRLTRSLALLALSFLLASSLYADAHIYWSPFGARTDFRGAARYLEKHVEPEEVILLISGHVFPVFEYYYRGANWHPLPDIPALDLRRTLDYDVAIELNRLLQGHTGVWVIGWQDSVIDPSQMVPWFLAQAGTPLPVENQFNDLTLRHYALPPDVYFPQEPAPQHSVGVRFGDSIELLGYDQDKEVVTLYWRVLRDIPSSYGLILQLRDEAGLVWGKQTARPTTYDHPTKYWWAGQILVGEHRLEPLSGTPPGQYQLEIGLYDEATLERLDATGLAGIPLGEAVLVEPVVLADPAPPPTSEELSNALSLTVDLNADLGVRGYGLWPRQVRSGMHLFLTLFWEARRPVATDCRVRVSLQDATGRVVGEQDYLLTGEGYPPSRWKPGWVMRGQYLFRVPVDIGGGPMQLQMALISTEGRPVSEMITVAPVEVEAVEVRFQVPPMERELGVRFGDWAELLGYDLALSEVDANVPPQLVLYWRALEPPPPTDFTVFTHILNAEGVLIGQHDGPPAGGTRPTSGWQLGEVIVDAHELALVDISYHGPARVEVGLYNPLSGERESVTDGSNHVVLPSLITVK